LLKKRFEFLEPVSLVLLIHEVHLVAEETDAHDAPHVVGEVGVIPFHAPPFGCGREGAQHQELGVGGKKGLERMGLDRIIQLVIEN
jgi:hypothetical protein